MAKSYQLFLTIITFFTLVNLLVMNDVATIWSGAEAYNLIGVEMFKSPQTLIQWVIYLFGEPTYYHPFMVRLVGVLVAVLGGVGVYFSARKIFGTPTVISTILIASSSLLLVNISKFATGDIWTATFQTLAILSQIRYLKENNKRWRSIHLVLLAVAIWISPIQTTLLFIVFSILLYFLHPQGKGLVNLYQWIIIPWFLGALYIFDSEGFFTNHSYFSTLGQPSLSHHFYWLIFIGMLPWIGFLLAGLWQTVKRFRKREEFSILIFCWLVAAILFKSFSVLWLFAILAGKQLENYQLPNFPKVNENIIKTFSLLNLIAAFCGAIYLMLNMFYIFEAPGFRAAMLTGAVYWMPLIFGVIGLYGKNDKLIRAGFTTAGVLVTLLFWLQIYPYIETQRDLPKQVTLIAVEQKATFEDGVYLSGNTNFQSNLWYYLMRSKNVASPVAIENKLLEIYEERGTKALILNQNDYDILAKANPNLKAEAIKGWTEAGKEETYWIVK